MTSDAYPLLRPFFQEGRGTVYYKAYPPYRGDDVQSVIELARILPPGVTFIPIPPRIPHVGDLRHLLKSLLDAALTNVRRTRSAGPASTGNALDPVPAAPSAASDVSDTATGAPDASPSAPLEIEPPRRWPLTAGDIPDETSDTETWRIEHEIEQSVLELVKECLPAERRSQAARLIEEIRNEPLYPALREIVSATIYGGVDDLSFAPIVPDEGPVLVIGRPELFHHDVPLESLKSPHSLANILKDAGYPNRFDFLSESDDVRFNTRGLRDRKTNLQHFREERFKDDVGFVFVNRLSDGRTVIVAAGTTAFGTYAAVKLLTENRPAFARAMARHEELRGGPATLDIAFRCWHHRAKHPMLFPFAQPPQHLTIVPLNQNDMVGFRWNRESHDLLAPLLNWWSPHEPLDGRPERTSDTCGGVRWSWEPRPATAREKAERVLVNVAVEAPAYQAGDHVIVCGRRMAEMLGTLKQQLKDDLKDWLSRVRWRRRRKGKHDTFRPILLVGETGTGKTVIADAISEVWPGTTLDDDRHRQGEEGSARREDRNANALLDAAARGLDRRLATWPDLSSPGAPRIITFCVSAFPATMLDKELFGCSARYANDTNAAYGVFLQAGTGILFLDELLELPTEQLTRLLVALQKGSVRPLGAEKDYEFHCRLIAATNRAASIQDLERQAQLNELNPAIVARFKQRYEVLPLRERPEEIIPQLIHFIRLRVRDILPQRNEPMPSEICVRISRPALDTLLGHDFPENVRELERFVNSLPRDLVASFCTRWTPDPSLDRIDLARTAQAIRLEHLNVLRPRAPGAEEMRIPGSTRGLDEHEFYQLTLKLHVQELAPSRDEWFDDEASTGPTASPLPLQTPAPQPAPLTDLRVDTPHDESAPVLTRPVLQIGASVGVGVGAGERSECLLALASLRRTSKGRQVDRLFGTSEQFPDGDFPLFDAVNEHLMGRSHGAGILVPPFDDEVFSAILKTACDALLARRAAMSDEPFEMADLSRLQTNRDWRVVRRRLPFAFLAVPLHKAANDPDYAAASRIRKGALRKLQEKLREGFTAWNHRHYASGNANELLSLLLGEDVMNLR